MNPFKTILKTLRNYNRETFKADLKAGTNVALLDFPQGMAYASIAGFPVQIGIYCSAIASISGPFLASSRFVMLGPTNATAVLLLSAFLVLDMSPGEKLAVLPLLLVMVGIFVILGSFLRLAKVINYVSRSVVTGYITAAAFLIIVNQMRSVLGFQIPSAASFFETLSLTLTHLKDTQWIELVLGCGTAAIFLTVKRTFKGLPHIALTLLVVSLGAEILIHYGYPVHRLQSIPSGTWPLTFPEVSFENIGRLANAAFAVAFLSVLESASIAKTLAARSGDHVDINQQMLSMGVANLLCSVGSGMPVSGSLTRSVLNWSSGAKTQLSSVFSGTILVAGILLFGPVIGFIPKSALATLVIFVGLSLIQPNQIRVVLKSTKSDATVFLITLMSGLLFPLDTAIYLGAASSIILFLNKVSAPELVEYAFNEEGELAEKSERLKKKTPEISIVHVEGNLFFGSSEIFLDQMRLLCGNPNIKIIILRLRNAHYLDATSCMAIGDLIHFARDKGSDIIVSGVRKDVERVFRNSGLLNILGEKNFFVHSLGNPNISTRYALKRAQEIMGEEKANIILFAKARESKDESKS